MDVFSFTNPDGDTKMMEGRIINGLTSKLWVERYRESGEFKFTAPASQAMIAAFPRGSFVSHADTKEIMIVENHEIVYGSGQNPELVVSGRGFETFFENRIVGANKTFPTSGDTMEYIIAAAYAQSQAVILLRDHTDPGFVVDADDAVPYMTLQLGIGAAGPLIERSIKRGVLYERLLEFLSIDDWGIKIVRPGVWDGLGSSNVNFIVLIHKGVDLSSSLLFSHQTGEIETAEYLWSIKADKNTAIVNGRWVDTKVTTGFNEYDRRVLLVDASDIDDQYTVAPTGGDLTSIISAMQQRGTEALANHNTTAFSRIELSKKATRTQYRTDFDVGDIVTVVGEYGASSKFRISEYVEVEDKTGSQAYPTLSPI